MIKLSDWCKKHGIKYLTGYRWFKDGKMPVQAYQTPSGTILVDDVDMDEDSLETGKDVKETFVLTPKPNDSPVAQVIKKAVEISKSGASVEDLATFVISNFRLSEHDAPEAAPPTRRASKMKPTKEMTENHFKQFMKSSKPKPDAKMFLVNERDLDSVVDASEKASAMESLGVEFTAAQKFGKVVPSITPAAATDTDTSKNQSIASMMNTVIHNPQNIVATPKTLTSLENSCGVFRRAVDSGTVTNNSTLSAASVTASASNFNAPASASVAGSYCITSPIVAESTLEFDDTLPEPLNEALAYHPVTYDEARALLSLIADTNTISNPLALDRRAKELCKLNRETFDMMVLAAQATRK